MRVALAGGDLPANLAERYAVTEPDVREAFWYRLVNGATVSVD